MNRIDLTLGHAGVARLEIVAGAIAATFRALSEPLVKIHHAWVAARVRSELHALSDRTLKDIGLSRGQIDTLFR